MDRKVELTIFTPTLNRRSQLVRLYKSLCSQTSKSFIWHIIDDGSSDGTKALINAWIEEELISIKFTYQENIGKIKTMNKGIKEAKTNYWMCLDSDDWLHKDAVKKIEHLFLKLEERNDLCGIIGLRYASSEPMQGKEIPKSFETINYHELRYKMKIEPEYVAVYKTQVIKYYLFPEIKGESYFPISYLDDSLSRDYDFLVMRGPVMYCEYQEDGITKNRKKLILQNPIGYMLFKKQLVEIGPTFKTKFISAIAYNSASILSNRREPISTLSGKILSLVTYPLGWIDYFLRFKLKASIHLEKTYK